MYEVSFPSTSIRADWFEVIELRDTETEELIPLDGCRVVVEVKDPRTKSVVMTASTDDGDVEIVSEGYFEFHFTPDDMSARCLELHDVFCRISRDGETAQLFMGKVPFVDGGSSS